jgi:hypothetical protein
MEIEQYLSLSPISVCINIVHGMESIIVFVTITRLANYSRSRYLSMIRTMPLLNIPRGGSRPGAIVWRPNRNNIMHTIIFWHSWIVTWQNKALIMLMYTSLRICGRVLPTKEHRMVKRIRMDTRSFEGNTSGQSEHGNRSMKSSGGKNPMFDLMRSVDSMLSKNQQ